MRGGTVFLINKARNAAVIDNFRAWAPTHALKRRDRLLRFPPWGNVLSLPCERREPGNGKAIPIEAHYAAAFLPHHTSSIESL